MVGLERNQQAETAELRNLTRVRVLKNRLTGETGEATCLAYNNNSGRLVETQPIVEEIFDGDGDF